VSEVPRYVWSTSWNATLIHVAQGWNHTGDVRIGSAWESPCSSITLKRFDGCDAPWGTPENLSRCPVCFNTVQRAVWDRLCIDKMEEMRLAGVGS